MLVEMVTLRPADVDGKKTCLQSTVVWRCKIITSVFDSGMSGRLQAQSYLVESQHKRVCVFKIDVLANIGLREDT